LEDRWESAIAPHASATGVQLQPSGVHGQHPAGSMHAERSNAVKNGWQSLCSAKTRREPLAASQHAFVPDMASSSGATMLPLSALDFSSGVFGIDPLVRMRAGEEVTLEDEVRHHGVFFDQLLTMIPAQYYLKDEEAAEEQWKSKFWRVRLLAAVAASAWPPRPGALRPIIGWLGICA